MFNYQKLLQGKVKKHDYIQQSRFYRFVIDDLLDRLEPIDKVFKDILLIGDSHDYLESLLAKKYPAYSFIKCPLTSALDFNSNQFDLIIFPFGLHWIKDVQGFLAKVNFILKTDGIFIGNFAGGGTLSNLRKLLLDLEITQTNIHHPHISPFIQFQHMTPLFAGAGFAENIIDFEMIELEYKTPLLLMKEIQQVGESNCLDKAICYSITKTMYDNLKSSRDTSFIDQLNMISFISGSQKHNITLKSEYFQK
jgi:NADH dehydrogenase [ubiquinone] 1 alpha subcomplex assembly factor 5